MGHTSLVASLGYIGDRRQSLFQREHLGSTCFFLRGREPHIRLLACREERQQQSTLALDARALCCIGTVSRSCVKKKSSEPNSAGEMTRLGKVQGSVPGFSPVLLRESRLLTALVPPPKDGPHFSFALENKKITASFIKREEKFKTGPGGTVLSSQLLWEPEIKRSLVSGHPEVNVSAWLGRKEVVKVPRQPT